MTDKLKAAQALARARKAAPQAEPLVGIVVQEGRQPRSDAMTQPEHLIPWLQQQINTGRLRSVTVRLNPPEDVYLGSMKGDR